MRATCSVMSTTSNFRRVETSKSRCIGSHPGAAVGAEDLAGDERRVVAGEIGGGLADLFGLAGATERDSGEHHVAMKLEEALAHVGADEARRDAVHPHSRRRALLGERLGERIHSRL